ncbi:MAG: hypothetical protein IKL95_00135 [Alphaproteobacteria bacterium]|nr:hypothetical protein [Alphaproteobacteria bacterium]
MEDKQKILILFSELLFKIKLIEAEVNVMEISDMDEWGINELENIANNFITTGKNLQEEIEQKMHEGL